MQPGLHHPIHWMHREAVTVGHWCRMHMLHDYHFWLYMLIAAVIALLIALMISHGGGGTVLDRELHYYAYPYSTF